ncbi:arsenate reductase (glutaredoxin) [Antarcticibacterium sp. 1MA-6-2]|uniref:arsenate reductase (glutaredoxin) n=1 Tax=Antarcticibacterium sp. 1MA-6-2 TaxID=2908210 RepID=UPI001EEBC418|nr:arsenate reductase (glutaredoxin) [Antarcticibacterium sp. 1MA-6-2]UJH91525.1 arsenate reductase (glutaredoxin) [Antarcticibacterium sp. 1MA-6-2]
MITIYHNSRCSKSREGLKMLEKSGRDFKVREYLKEPLSKDEIRDLVVKLKVVPIQLVRKGEAIWKENYKDKDLGDEEIIQILSENPKLIERPIIENEDKAVIGRPSSNIDTIL